MKNKNKADENNRNKTTTTKKRNIETLKFFSFLIILYVHNAL